MPVPRVRRVTRWLVGAKNKKAAVGTKNFHRSSRRIRPPVDVYQKFICLVSRVVVIAVAAGIKYQRHQSAADQQRKHDAAGNGHIAVDRDVLAAEMRPG